MAAAVAAPIPFQGADSLSSKAISTQRDCESRDGWGIAQRLNPELQLVERCLGGEQGAWDELIKTYSRRVYALCFRFTNNENEAQDLTQEVFFRVFRSLGSFRIGEGCFT